MRANEALYFGLTPAQYLAPVFVIIGIGFLWNLYPESPVFNIFSRSTFQQRSFTKGGLVFAVLAILFLFRSDARMTSIQSAERGVASKPESSKPPAVQPGLFSCSSKSN